MEQVGIAAGACYVLHVLRVPVKFDLLHCKYAVKGSSTGQMWGSEGLSPSLERRISNEKLAGRSDLIEELDVAAHGAIQAFNLRVLRFDQVIFVGRMRAVSVAEAELDGRQL